MAELRRTERDELVDVLVMTQPVEQAADAILASDWLRERDASKWDEGFTKAGRLIFELDREPWPPAPNPYREEVDR